jgi:putative ABC transport system permease protein
MRSVDLLHVATEALRARRGRIALSAVGIAIGIATMVTVVGISQSSRADLLAQLDRLGTNLLTVTPGRDPSGGTATLPLTAPSMLARIAPVHDITAIAQLDATVRRSDRIPEADTGALTVAAAPTNLLDTLHATLARGRYLDPALERYPTVVLGAAAAQQLGIDLTDGQAQLFINNQWFTVVGILRPVPLISDLDRSVLVGYPEATHLTGVPPPPTTIYLRANPDDVPAVQAVLATTANPAHPGTVSVSRPSDALAARAAAKTTLTTLLVGLGAVALLVGGLGIANVMIVAVLERRAEIGVRRALGATRSAIAGQFLTEALLLAVLGGLLGTLAGSLATHAWAHHQHWPTNIPPAALGLAILAAATVGTIAGLIPAARASRLSPTEALRT